MYKYALTPAQEFEDRGIQFTKFGVPATEVDRLRSTITDMWLEGPGGWVYEWSKLAADYAAKGDHTMASLVYGFARFPCIADQQRVDAQNNQIGEFLKAAPTFPIHFERRIITVPYGGKTVDVPVHIYSATGDYESVPAHLTSGGVDTFKIDFHASYITQAQVTGATIIAFDIPGTAELRHVPLRGASDEVVLGLVAAARKIGNGKVTYSAFSFGGNFAALVGLSGAVDACVDNGGPVQGAFTADHMGKLPFGMFDIVANAVGYDAKPTLDQLVSDMNTLSRAVLFEQQTNCPMYVINGADDYFVPSSDTLIFQGRPNTEVHLVPGTGHCCLSKLDEVTPWMNEWIRKQVVSLTTPAGTAS